MSIPIVHYSFIDHHPTNSHLSSHMLARWDFFATDGVLCTGSGLDSHIIRQSSSMIILSSQRPH
jgi:hypothetical protein